MPGVVAVLLIFFVREEEAARRPGGEDVQSHSGSASPVAERLPAELRAFLWVLALFTLGNSTDAFLLLRLTDVRGSAAYIPLMWAALHVVKASVSVVAAAGPIVSGGAR